MAVVSSSDTRHNMREHKEKMKSPNKKENKSQNPGENALSPSPAKRSRGPRLQVVGGRIYDSVNGRTCHQVFCLNHMKPFLLDFLIFFFLMGKISKYIKCDFFP